MKIIFFGTPEFAIPTLETLYNEGGFDVVTVVTNPDEPVGRKKQFTPSPIKHFARHLNIKVLEPEKLKDNEELIEELKSLEADIAVVVAYGKILPAEYLTIPRLGFVNVHYSLLPKYRGATPIQSAILEGEEKTGITIMQIDEELDHGPILAQEEYPIEPQDNTVTLKKKFSKLGAVLLIKTLKQIKNGESVAENQDHAQATYTKKFTREDARIDWAKKTDEILRQIRALNPEPGTWTMWKDKVLKIEMAQKTTIRSDNDAPIGKVSGDFDSIQIKTKDGWLTATIVQLEGKSPVQGKDFLRGHRKLKEEILT